MKTRIALMAGGYSGEFDVSMKSAQTIFENIDSELFDTYLLEISKNGWFVLTQNERFQVDLNTFSFRQGAEEIRFDYAYIIIHGSPGEDGKLQGYLEMQQIPYSTGSVLNTALTFNKAATQQLMKSRRIPIAEHLILRKAEVVNKEEIVEQIGLPCFVKPTESGSSLGVSKVRTIDELDEAIDTAMRINGEVLIEAMLDGKELGCGVYRKGNEVIALPVTEIITSADFFDYKAKYEDQATEEITPAQISEDAYIRCQHIAKEVYEITQCEGIARADFFLCDEELFLVEINTVPGMSKESIVPKQIAEAKIDLKQLLTEQINTDLKNFKHDIN